MKALRRIALMSTVAATAAMVSSTAFAQSTTAGLRVRVVNENGEALANVPLQVTHIPTGRTRTVETNSTGGALLRGLPVGGPYLVRVADGSSFLAMELNDIFLELGQTESVTIGAVQMQGSTPTTEETSQIEEISVTGIAGSQTILSGPGREFTASDIAVIPSVGRDFSETLALDPKIAVDNGVARGPSISIAGQNFRFNTLTIDGIPQNDSFGLSFNASATQRSPISIDAIQSINVNVAPIDVEFGNFAGGNINIVTKSGTNEFHGTAYGFYTDAGLTGNESDGVDLGRAIGDFDETIFGATFSGPIIEDKLFFFAGYERFETTRPANQTSLEELSGFAPGSTEQQAFVNEIAEIQDIFRNVYGFEPGDFETTDDDADEKIIAKIDWNIDERHRAAFTFQRASGDFLRDDFANVVSLNTSRYNTEERVNSWSAQVFSDWTDNFSTEFKFGIKDVRTRQNSIDISTPFFNIPTSTGVPVVAGGDPFRGFNELDNSSTLLKLKGTYVTGDHSITFGYELDRFDVRNQFSPFFRGQVSYTSIDDFRNNLPFLFLIGGSVTGDVTDIAGEFTLNTHTFYLQDRWQVTDNLELTAGVRFDFLTNDVDILENQEFINRNGFTNTTNLDGKNLFSPRVGANWTPTDRLTVRVGAGIFGGGAPNIFLNGAYQANGLERVFTFASLDLTRIGIPVPPSAEHVATANALPSGTALQDNLAQFIETAGDPTVNDVDALDPDFDIFNNFKLSLGVDYALDLTSLGMGDDWNVTFDYIYTDVIDGFAVSEARREIIGTAPDGRPVYNLANGTDFILGNTSEGRSHVFAVAVDKFIPTEDWGDWTLNFGYTYTDATDPQSYNRFINGEAFAYDPQFDLNNPAVTRSAFETRHRLTARVTWEKELFQDDAFTRVTLFYNGRSGTPYNFVFDGGPFEGTGLAFGGNGTFESASALSPGSSLFYVPTGLNDPLVTGDQALLSALDSFISSNDCLDGQRGQVYERNSCTNSWIGLLDLNITQEVNLWNDHKVELLLNIQNFGNLLNSDWGRVQRARLEPPESVALTSVSINEQNQFVYAPVGANAGFVAPTPVTVALPSTYRIQFGIRYRF